MSNDRNCGWMIRKPSYWSRSSLVHITAAEHIDYSSLNGATEKVLCRLKRVKLGLYEAEEFPKSRTSAELHERLKHEVVKIWLPSKPKVHQTISDGNWTATSVQLVAIVDVAIIRSGQYPPGLQDILFFLKVLPTVSMGTLLAAVHSSETIKTQSCNTPSLVTVSDIPSRVFHFVLFEWYFKHGMSSFASMQYRPVVDSMLAHRLYACDPGSIPGRVTPDFRMWESCRTMPLIDGFSRGSPVSPVISSRQSASGQSSIKGTTTQFFFCIIPYSVAELKRFQFGRGDYNLKNAVSLRGFVPFVVIFTPDYSKTTLPAPSMAPMSGKAWPPRSPELSHLGYFFSLERCDQRRVSSHEFAHRLNDVCTQPHARARLCTRRCRPGIKPGIDNSNPFCNHDRDALGGLPVVSWSSVELTPVIISEALSKFGTPRHPNRAFPSWENDRFTVPHSVISAAAGIGRQLSVCASWGHLPRPSHSPGRRARRLGATHHPPSWGIPGTIDNNETWLTARLKSNFCVMTYDPINTAAVQQPAVIGEGHLAECGRKVRCGTTADEVFVLGVNGREGVKPDEHPRPDTAELRDSFASGPSFLATIVRPQERERERERERGRERSRSLAEPDASGDDDPRQEDLLASALISHVLIRARSAITACLPEQHRYKRPVLQGIFQCGWFRNLLPPRRAAVAERLACSPPINVNRVQPPAVTPGGFSHVGMVPDDGAGRRIFSGISHFPAPSFRPASYSPQAPPSALKTSLLRATQISSLFFFHRGSQTVSLFPQGKVHRTT
ncbi:hypothetical protein PR048_029364 [Dryococelus australis]|uniref:Uncharacterized protein n=1 Tax=Dryococelus australis TaxID=614101 RepID=A0ABQ9GFS6_9NEOP|nr:hypothetical protein PR048_029364 [Dryococelus australis]